MAYYFSYLPKVNYKIDGVNANKTDTVVDITRRFKITQLLNNREVIYFDYSVQDGDRPDIIAEKLYDDYRLDWLVLLPNEIHDRYFEWVMSTNEFNSFIIQKYGSVSNAQAQVHHYERIIVAKQTLNDGTIIPERKVIVDETTYNTLSDSSRRIVTAYDEEDNRNESHRNIKLIDPALVTDVVRQARRAYN